MSEPGQGRIRKALLQDGAVEVTILSLGAITQRWLVPLGDARVPVVLGYDTASAYRHNPFYMGAIVGRVANRIAGGRFDMNGRTVALCRNDGPNHLHGGPSGLHRQNWTLEPDGARAVRLTHRSPHGAGGYPGAVAFQLTIRLRGFTLRYEMRARPDRPTPISLAQHSYYTLATTDCRLSELSVDADQITSLNDNHIPSGGVDGVAGTAFDFTTPRLIGAAAIDQTYICKAGAKTTARLQAPNGLQLQLTSDQPGLQVYTGHHLAPLHGQDHRPFSGLCLEPQGIPDSVNQPCFPSIIASPDQPYSQVLEVAIAPPEAIHA